MRRQILLLILFLTSALLGQSPQKKVLIVHSYSQEYPWTKRQHEAFVRTLTQDHHRVLHIETEYLDTKRIEPTNAYFDFFLRYLAEKYATFQPDLVYVTDDDALNFIRYAQNPLFTSVPVIFSGINDPGSKSKLDTGLYRGIFEVKEIEPNLKLINHFSRQAKEIWFVGDGSGTYRAIKKQLENAMLAYPNLTAHYIETPILDEALAQLSKLPRSFVLLTTIGGFKSISGRSLTLKESLHALTDLKQLMIISMEDAYLYPGVIGGFVTSGDRHGALAGQMAVKLLDGAPITDLRSTSQGQSLYMFDAQSVKEKGLILSEYVSRDAVILNQSKSFFESHHSLLLNLIFLLLITLIIFILLTLNMHRQLELRTKALEEAKAKEHDSPPLRSGDF